MKPISKLFFILYNLILIFIFKSFVNSQKEVSVTLNTINSDTDDTEPLLTLINTNRKLYYLYFAQKIYIYDYINNVITTTVNFSPSFQANQVTSYGFDKDYSTIFNINKDGSYYCIYVDNSNDLLSPTSYSISKDIKSVFSIGNGENDWRFVVINNYRIEFYNFLNIEQNDFTSYLAYFSVSEIYYDIKCTYWNNEVYCIGFYNTDYKLYIIPIEQISESKVITSSDMTYASDYYLGEFLKIYNFVYSQPLIILKQNNIIFISDFYNNKITVINSNGFFYEDGFLIGEINKNQYYMCSIKKYNTNMILCNIIPYSQNTITSNFVNLEQDIYTFTTNYKYLLGNENNNGIIMTLIDDTGTFSFIGILDPTISSTLINVYPQMNSDNSIINTINCYNLDIYNNYYLYINDINGIIYLNNQRININNYYLITGNDQLIFYIEDNVEFILKYTLNFGKGIINYETFNYDFDIFNNNIKRIILNINSYISNSNINEEKEIKYQIYYYSDSKSYETIALNNNLSIVKFTDSQISLIKQLNNINENDDIVIMKIDIKIGDYPVPTVYYLVTDLTGKILNISSFNIVVEKPILNTKLIDIEKAKNLNEKSIDIFNSSAPFFNDICFTFSSEKNGKDVTLKDRRDDYYVNVTFCESECELSYIDYVNVKVVCNCNLLSNYDNFELLSFSNLKNAFVTHLFN